MARKKKIELHGWTADVWDIVRGLRQPVTLRQLYVYESFFWHLHPANKNIRAKIRQQLQKLRDLSLVEFVRPGVYRRKGR